MRYLTPFIARDLTKKMVLVGGPRQVGKTTLAQSLLPSTRRKSYYYNWDDPDDRRAIRQRRWLADESLLIFDELHKMARWKTWLKGLYDKYRAAHQILVTGSARLDLYRRGGDSLLGRYHYWRLHPFSLHELPPRMKPQDAFRRLMTVGGFPEPFLANDPIEAKRWRTERYARILREDIRDLETIRDLSHLAILADALRTRVGTPVVYAHLAQDMEVAFKSIRHWVALLETMYLLFLVPPYTHRLARAIKKPPKIYFFDNADVLNDDGARFENLVATHLLKRLHFLEDSRGDRWELRYLRDKEGREIDFVLTCDGRLEELIEVKWSEDRITPSLRYYAERLQPKRAVQIVGQLKRSYSHGRCHVLSPFEYFAQLAPLG
ncbi:MAG: ATP-binding protein [Deltaproteobacteria bacterium]|nr:ATP-binding protein [Deltaproteobacteria bacterium]